MISPDLSILVDLRNFDTDPHTLRTAALEAVKEELADEGYDPQTGDPDVVLLSGTSWIASQVIAAANRAPWGALTGLLAAMGVPWNAGTKATATVLITGVEDTVISSGTIITTADAGLSEQIAFVTTQQAVIVEGGVEVPVEAYKVGSLPNRLPVGTDMAASPRTYLISEVDLVQRPTGGTDPETTDEYYARVASRLARLCDSLVTATHFTQAALESSLVHRATTIDCWDGSSAQRTQWGHVTVVVCGLGGTLLTSLQLEDLAASLSDRAVHHLTVHCINATLVSVDVTTRVRRMSGYSAEQTADDVEAVMELYISPDNWNWGETVEPADLLEVLGRDVAAVDVALSLAAPAADVVLADNELPVCGAVTVTVVDP